MPKKHEYKGCVLVQTVVKIRLRSRQQRCLITNYKLKHQIRGRNYLCVFFIKGLEYGILVILVIYYGNPDSQASEGFAKHVAEGEAEVCCYNQGKKDLGNPLVLWGFFSTATSRNTWAHQMRPPFSAQPAQPPPRTNGASVLFFSTLFMLLY